MRDQDRGRCDGRRNRAHAPCGEEDRRSRLGCNRSRREGWKVTEGTVSKIDHGGKVLAVKTADGVEATYKITDHAVEDAGKDIGKGVEKASKVDRKSTRLN